MRGKKWQNNFCFWPLQDQRRGVRDNSYYIRMTPNSTATSDMGLNPSWLFLPIFLLCFASIPFSEPLYAPLPLARQSECNLVLFLFLLTLNASMTPRAKWVNWRLAGNIRCYDRSVHSSANFSMAFKLYFLIIIFLSGEIWSLNHLCLLSDNQYTQQELCSEFQSNFFVLCILAAVADKQVE